MHLCHAQHTCIHVIGYTLMKIPEWLGMDIVADSWTALARGLTDGSCQ